MILYPTETIYGLGVNALNEAAVFALEQFKGDRSGKFVSWLVRDVKDIAYYGELSPVAAKIAEQFLPGSLTLVLRPKDTVPNYRRQTGEVSFRIAPDPVSQQLIAEFMAEHRAPLTATSANVSGQPTESTPQAILEQFKAHGRDLSLIERVIDDGPRSGLGSTVVRVFDDTVEILREGAVPAHAILEASR